jgi:PIN domain nuclease of toxin-antitoxin system
MTGLLDTHALLWFIDKDPRLSPAAQAFLVHPANSLVVSIVTIWEIAIKVNIGKLTLAEPYEKYITDAIRDNKLAELPITLNHTTVLTTVPLHHRDPFDRLLISQAIWEKMPLLSADKAFDPYPITRIW